MPDIFVRCKLRFLLFSITICRFACVHACVHAYDLSVQDNELHFSMRLKCAVPVVASNTVTGIPLDSVSWSITPHTVVELLSSSRKLLYSRSMATHGNYFRVRSKIVKLSSFMFPPESTPTLLQ
jgi:hypothetical protein